MSIQNNLTSSSIRKYLPSKVIAGLGTSISGLESWMYDDGYGDPWWQGAGGAPYRWILTADIVASNHSSHLTRVPLLYTGLDITPRMWVYADGDAKAVKIVSIISKTDSTIVCLVEDVDRYNTFSDSTAAGNGIFSEGRNLVFFELGNDGLPILNPLPAGSDIGTVSQVEARFRVFNPTIENRFFQLSHGFKEGYVVKLDSQSGNFINASSNDLYIVGTVVGVGPGPNYFYLTPSTKIINNLEPGLPGSAGDIIWLSSDNGDRSLVQAGSISPLYIKMTNGVPAFTIGSVDNPVTFDGTRIKLNNHTIEFNSSGEINTQSIIATINQSTISTGVLSSLSSPKNIVSGLNPYPSSVITNGMQFSLNGILIEVNSPSIVYGDTGQIGWWDIIRGINEQTTKHNVYSSFDSNTGLVVFTNDFGGDINFVNLTLPASVSGDLCFTDMVGLQPNNPPGPETKIKLLRSDGGQIAISDVAGSFSYDTGLQSADNGSLPLALVIDKSMMSNQNFVVADIAGRDGLTNVRSGDQVFVQSATDNEWALFVRTSTSWTKIADYDSAKTDADTISVEITHSSAPTVLVGTISSSSRIVNVTVVVHEVFDGTNASLNVGTLLNPSIISSDSNSDLAHVDSYENSSSYSYQGLVDGDITVHFASNGSTTGRAVVVVSYL